MRQLRAELEAAVAEGASSPVRFVVGPVELDLEVATTVAADAKAEVKLWVVTVGGGGSGSRTATQRIHFTLTPKAVDGSDLDVAELYRGTVPE
ncbi:trypco2 family protein [Pseudonocardia sp. GCM10023141]|uniref:trypco2 family protein n=1 Tax=Pseudonocardia sp. GCM10023141 TaxID=3252653 RepID=UPI003611A314